MVFFFFNDTATTEIYTLSLHDALPISARGRGGRLRPPQAGRQGAGGALRPLRRGDQRGAALGQPPDAAPEDRKSTRLNSSHANISYAVFCLKKKKYHQDSSTS